MKNEAMNSTDGKEQNDEHYERLVAMTEPTQETWDLSPNDVKAIECVLRDNQTLRSRLAEVEKERDTALDNADFWERELNNFRRNAAARAEELTKDKVEAAESALAKMQWVSVEERLPDNQDYSDSFVPLYLVLDKDGYALAERYDNEWWGEFGVIREVTHWRPLPEPPGAALGRDKEG